MARTASPVGSCIWLATMVLMVSTRLICLANRLMIERDPGDRVNVFKAFSNIFQLRCLWALDDLFLSRICTVAYRLCSEANFRLCRGPRWVAVVLRFSILRLPSWAKFYFYRTTNTGISTL
jgi:hypothetical protein